MILESFKSEASDQFRIGPFYKINIYKAGPRLVSVLFGREGSHGPVHGEMEKAERILSQFPWTEMIFDSSSVSV